MRRLLAPLAVLTLVAAGCGSSDSGSSSSPTAADSTPAASTKPAAGATVAIGMEGLRFNPDNVTVKVGQTVKWTDLEDIPHNVTAESGADFTSDTFGKGKSFEFKAVKAGTIKYVCTIHPGMAGTLTVEG